MTMSAFKKILCPTDFSEASYEGLDKAVLLASEAAAEICVVHVEPPTRSITAYAGHAPEAHQEVQRRAETVKNLCAVLEQRVSKSVRTRPLVKQGETATEIIRAACEEGADLIVLTTHGAGGLAPGELGRVAASIVQTAPCPVLTVNRSSSTPTAGVCNTDETAALRPEFEVVHSTPKALYLDGD
jgi:nucleotide-binding universal stress UspA family protein